MHCFGEGLDSCRHGAWEPMDGRPFLEDFYEAGGVVLRDSAGLQRAQAGADLLRTSESRLHGDLLIEQHTRQQRKGVVTE
ncbi:hypothetical protein D3C73_1520600 [compost metagenome]